MEYCKKTRVELIEICKQNNIKGVSNKTKNAIIEILTENSKLVNKDVTPIELAPIKRKKPEVSQIGNSYKPTFIEVCAGCGGLSTGFIKAGFRPLLINELEKQFCETLQKNHPNMSIEQGSMTDLDLTPYKGMVDILQGGVPCQAFSQAGERKGLDDPRGQLIVYFNKLVNDCEPRMFLVENVKGLVTHNNGKTFNDILEMFKNNGKYRVYHKILNANDYEVPQKRERVIIIGVHNSISKDFTYPIKSDKKVVLQDVLLDVPPSIGATYSKSKEDVMKMVPQGGCWINLPDDIQKQYMGEKSLSAGGGKRGIARRLAMNEPSLTLTTSPCQKQTERCHPIETRPLNVREYARIQTFPDSYQFCGSMHNQYKQIGNAVPVNLAFAIANQIKKFLDVQ